MNNKADLGFLFFETRPITYKKGEVILRPENPPSGVYYIKRGFIRLYTISESGEELTLIVFKAGDFFPIIWAVNNTPNTQYCEAMTEAEVYRIPREKFSEFLKKKQEAGFVVLGKILERLGGLLERIEYLVFGNAYQKTASILVICAERFGEKKGNEITIKVPLTHKDVANFIGLTRETTSLEIKKLERKGIIARRGKHIVIKKMAQLQEEARWVKK